MTYTNDRVHDILRTGFDKSPMFSGRIQGIGPRYCPSIEDKIDRFADKERHQLFIEPEGWNTCEVYINGFSTSLPYDVQYAAIRSVAGLENVKMFRPGYAIEYDYFPPQQLSLTLESKAIGNLFLAGQINGTTGYEEAACQGLMAGINAHRKICGLDSLLLRRSEAYIGVLLDDLVTKGTEEPYRMFTSRAEYRILLRQDNADERLIPIGHSIGLIDIKRYENTIDKYARINDANEYLINESAIPDDVNDLLLEFGTSTINQKVKYHGLVSRPQVTLTSLVDRVPTLTKSLVEVAGLSRDEVLLAEIRIKYEGYIKKEHEIAEKLKRLEHIELHADFDYSRLSALSTEARQKLSTIKPSNIGQASRISGVSPSDISVLMVYLGR
jgi:tRNA uridine 5-carboxymethylaminomethyl modification enzyme